MNKVRRKALDEVISKIEEAKELLENLQAEEEEYRDNMPALKAPRNETNT